MASNVERGEGGRGRGEEESCSRFMFKPDHFVEFVDDELEVRDVMIVEPLSEVSHGKKEEGEKGRSCGKLFPRQG